MVNCNEIRNTYIVKNQPDHGKTHIKSVDELKVGMKIGIRYERKSWGRDITISRITKNKIFYKAEVSDNYYFLADKGLKPYKAGWNRTNWIERLK